MIEEILFKYPLASRINKGCIRASMQKVKEKWGCTLEFESNQGVEWVKGGFWV